MGLLLRAEQWISPDLARSFFLAMVLVLVLLLGGCALTKPVRTAETPEQKAFALYATYVITLEQATGVLMEPSIPVSLAERVLEVAEVNRQLLATLRVLMTRSEGARTAYEAMLFACGQIEGECEPPDEVTQTAFSAQSALREFLQRNGERFESAINLFRSL